MCGWNIPPSAISWLYQWVVGLFVAVYLLVVPLSSIWLTGSGGGWRCKVWRRAAEA